MRIYTKEFYRLIKSIIEASPVKATLGISQVLVGSQWLQPANDVDNRKMSAYLNTVIIMDSPGQDDIGPFKQASADQSYTARLVYIRKVVAGENPTDVCSDDVSDLMDIFSAYEYNLNNIAEFKIQTLLPGPGQRAYDSDLTAILQMGTWGDVAVGWFDISVKGTANR